MTSAPHSLRSIEVRPDGSGRCTVTCQITLSGTQEITVRALAPVSGRGGPQIGVRIGPVLLLVSDPDALRSLVDVSSQAEMLADTAFGPRF